jgi:cob(I)alamin adenosyltransferase
LPGVKIYTKAGDRGETALLGGGRVPKDDLRVAAYGDVDELNAALGVVLTTRPLAFARPLLAGIQRDLFTIGGSLATPAPGRVARRVRDKVRIAAEQVRALERAIDDADGKLPALRAFVLPGGTPKAAALHLARTVCRRAERSVVHLARVEEVPPVIVTYMNRLSDLLFTLARLANRRARAKESTW